MEGSDVFRLRATNGPAAGEWRLKLHRGSETIYIGDLEAWEQVGTWDLTATITTTIEGTWMKQFLEGGVWVNRNGAHELSVQASIDNGWFCPPGPTYNLGDLVWYDVNQDGIQDPDEPGVEGIGVALFRDPTCGGAAWYTHTTDFNGGYLFTDLTTGTFCLQFEEIPPGWTVTLPNQGSDETLDSDAAPDTARIENISLEADDLDQDMGLYVDGSIGGQVWCDYDSSSSYDAGEELENISLSLFADADCDGVPDSLLTAMETISDGVYSFMDLPTGPPGATDRVCYVVIVDVNDPDLGVCTLPLGGDSKALLLNADAPDSTDADFPFGPYSGTPDEYRVYIPLVMNGR